MTGDPLAVVAHALRGAARRGASRVLAAAQTEAAHIEQSAHSQADALLARAGEDGCADAAAVASGHRARGRREARSIVLSAQRRAFDELITRARLAVRTELDPTGVDETLETLARKALGPDAVIVHDAGVVTATVSGRRLRLSLDDFADEAITELGLGP